MSRVEFRLPDVGEGLVEAEIVAWHVAAGERFVADQPLVSVETDKAVVELPAPCAGQVVRCVGEPGDRVAVGALLVELDTDREDPGAIVGDLAGTPVRASPAARRRARELGVDLARAEPSGVDRVVQVMDVEALTAGTSGEPLSGVRRAMARRMAEAAARVVPATVTDEADISHWTPELPESRPMVRLIQAVVAACAAVPRLNSAFDDRNLTLSAAGGVDLGLAMETDDGLFVPVLRDAGSLRPAQLASATERLEEAVRRRGLAPEELRGQSITLSNFGAVAGRHATMVVVPPQVAIVGAGRAFERVMLDDGAARAGRVVPLSVTFDHRAVTGVEACRFLGAMIEALEKED